VEKGGKEMEQKFSFFLEELQACISNRWSLVTQFIGSIGKSDDQFPPNPRISGLGMMLCEEA
jgi:hypothetical protein